MRSARSKLHLDAVIARAVREATSRVPPFGVTIDIDPDVPRHLRGDESLLQDGLVDSLERLARDEVALSIHVGLAGRRRARVTVASPRSTTRFAWRFEPLLGGEIEAREQPIWTGRILIASTQEEQRADWMRVTRDLGARPAAAESIGEAIGALREAERLGHPFRALLVAQEDLTPELLFSARGTVGCPDSCHVIVVGAEGTRPDRGSGHDHLVAPVTVTALARCLGACGASSAAQAA